MAQPGPPDRQPDGQAWRPGRTGRAVAGLAMAGLLGLGLLALGLPGAGARGPAVPADRPLPPWPPGSAGPARIVAFGTSLTAGNAWPDGLAAALAGCLGHPVEIHRVARPGVGSDWALGQIDRVAAAAPDLVLIEFAINDADIRDGVSPARAMARHAALVAGLEAALPGVPLMLMTTSPVSGILRQIQRPRLARHYAGYRALAAQEGLALADLAPRWQAALDAGLPPPADGLHPDDAATAAVVVPALTRMIGRAAGRDCSTGGPVADKVPG